jgi:hypothetical protein
VLLGFTITFKNLTTKVNLVNKIDYLIMFKYNKLINNSNKIDYKWIIILFNNLNKMDQIHINIILKLNIS